MWAFLLMWSTPVLKCFASRMLIFSDFLRKYMPNNESPLETLLHNPKMSVTWELHLLFAKQQFLMVHLAEKLRFWWLSREKTELKDGTRSLSYGSKVIRGPSCEEKGHINLVLCQDWRPDSKDHGEKTRAEACGVRPCLQCGEQKLPGSWKPMSCEVRSQRVTGDVEAVISIYCR